ncbi:hypothetical protein MRX96_057311 [Rhipicephalus microplus]
MNCKDAILGVLKFIANRCNDSLETPLTDDMMNPYDDTTCQGPSARDEEPPPPRYPDSANDIGVDTSLLSRIRGTFRFRCMAWPRR